MEEHNAAERKPIRRIIVATALVVANLFTASAGSIAWFLSQSKNVDFSTVSGDLDVSIDKVTAYRYVYPYYENSADYVNYDGEGAVKSYVLEDSSYPELDFEDDAVITLGEAYTGQSYITEGTSGTSSSILYEEGHPFLYYLVGDKTFSCVDQAWASTSGTAFSFNTAISDENPAILNGVVVSAGAEFTLFDAHGASGGSCSYLNYASIDTPAEGKSKRFSILNNKTIRCLQSGIYTFEYRPSSLTIRLRNKTNDVVFGNTLFDPTLATLDYLAAPTPKPDTVEGYLPTAIHAQKTMTVLDVALTYHNASEIDAGLQIRRLSSSAFSYADDYPDSSPLRASDFFAFYPQFVAVDPEADDPTASPLGTPTTVWNAFHAHQTDEVVSEVGTFSRFTGEGAVLTPDIHVADDSGLTKEETSVVLDPALNASYHCYIAVEYDHVHTPYFLKETRIGKTYDLDGDFYFYFTATQHLEGEGSTSAS